MKYLEVPHPTLCNAFSLPHVLTNMKHHMLNLCEERGKQIKEVIYFARLAFSSK